MNYDVSKLVSGEKPEFIKTFSCFINKHHEDLFDLIDEIEKQGVFGPNNRLMPKQRKKMMEGLEQNIKLIGKNINTPKKIACYGFVVWRTALEYAIEKELPIQVLMKLIEHGASPTKTACSLMAIKTNLFSKEEFGSHISRYQWKTPGGIYIKKVVELLSFSGANWNDNLVGIDPETDINLLGLKYYTKKHGTENPIANFIIETLGTKGALNLGVPEGGGRNNGNYEDDQDRFVIKLKPQEQKGRVIKGARYPQKKKTGKDGPLSIFKL